MRNYIDDFHAERRVVAWRLLGGGLAAVLVLVLVVDKVLGVG